MKNYDSLSCVLIVLLLMSLAMSVFIARSGNNKVGVHFSKLEGKKLDTVVIPVDRGYSVGIIEEKDQHTLIKLLPSSGKTYIYVYRYDNPPAVNADDPWVVESIKGEWEDEN